jgi:hypothetical protein
VLTCRPANPPKEPIRPMTLGSMRRLGVRSLAVSCHQCHHETIINADRWPGQMRVPSFGPRMVCTKCGAVGADVRRTGGSGGNNPMATGCQLYCASMKLSNRARDCATVGVQPNGLAQTPSKVIS